MFFLARRTRIAPSHDGRRALRALVRERITAHAHARGLSRREFLRTSASTATALLAINELYGCGGNGYALPRGAELDEEAARARLHGRELVFDAQTHHVSTARAFYDHNPSLGFLADAEQADCGETHWSACYSRERLLKALFFDSDTHLAALGALPGAGDGTPLFIREMAETRALAERLHGSRRLYLHGLLLPDGRDTHALRERALELGRRYGVCAYELCPAFGRDGQGWFLDGETGMAALQVIAESAVPRVAVHKGLPLPATAHAYSSPRDVGPAAKAFPNVTFFIRHAGYDPRHREGPYDRSALWGVDALLASLEAHGIGRNGNVYAELGGVFRCLMDRPDEAAHLLGKLLVQLGEDRVLWGSDAICRGCPQEQIEAFRAFEIGPAYQERFGYPALTPERKAKILGLNAVRAYGIPAADIEAALRGDAVSRLRASAGAAPERRPRRAWLAALAGLSG